MPCRRREKHAMTREYQMWKQSMGESTVCEEDVAWNRHGSHNAPATCLLLLLLLLLPLAQNLDALITSFMSGKTWQAEHFPNLNFVFLSHASSASALLRINIMSCTSQHIRWHVQGQCCSAIDCSGLWESAQQGFLRLVCLAYGANLPQ